AYCQDNKISWIDWTTSDDSMVVFVAQLIALRRGHPALRQDRWLGPISGPDGGRPVEWLRPDGAAMGVDDWHAVDQHTLMVRIGDPDDALLLLFNAEPTAHDFVLPHGNWAIVLSSAQTPPMHTN